MFEDTTEDGMTRSGKFTYIGHQVEIVPPDTARLIGNYWQIKIDGVLQHNFLFNSSASGGGPSGEVYRAAGGSDSVSKTATGRNCQATP